MFISEENLARLPAFGSDMFDLFLSFQTSSFKIVFRGTDIGLCSHPGRQIQAYDNQTGLVAGTDYACRVVVPWPNDLVKATLCCVNTVTTGTVEVFLKFVDTGGGRGGSEIGLKFENDDLDVGWTLANNFNKWDFDLGDYAHTSAPAWRQYFVVVTGTDSADRLDEMVLVLDVQRV